MSDQSMFDELSTLENVEKFSLALQDLIANSGIASNIVYVALQFYSNQMMNQIVLESQKRVAEREQCQLFGDKE